MRLLARRGYTTFHLGTDVPAALDELESHLADLGEPLHAFDRFPFWKELPTDLDRPPGRSGGTGFNSLHLDCVNMELPPDYIAFYCVRPDPLGGGANIVARFAGVASDLSDASRRILETTRVVEGDSEGLSGLGVDINPFLVLEGGRCRFTGRLLEAADVAENRDLLVALLELERALMNRLEVVNLGLGDAMIVDQRKVLHGRLPHGQGQAELDRSHSRLLVQAFGRARG